METREMQNHEAQHSATQDESSASQGCLLAPKTNVTMVTLTAKGGNLKARDSVVSQVMLGVLEEVFETIDKRAKEVEESKHLECEKKENGRVQNKKGFGPIGLIL